MRRSDGQSIRRAGTCDRSSQKLWPQNLSLRLPVAVLLSAFALPAAAEKLEISLSVLDPATLEQRAPEGDTRWYLEGPDGFTLAEQHAVVRMSYDVKPGHYLITVWEVQGRAAGSIAAQVGRNRTTSVSLLLSPPKAAPPLGLELRPAVMPGDPVTFSLPDLDDSANDIVALASDERGWVNSQIRGARDEVTLFAPDAPGNYRIEYVAVPEIRVLAETEIIVR